MTAGRRGLLVACAEVVAPVAVYYLARAAGLGPVPALLLGGVWPVCRVVAALVRGRRVDRLALLLLVLAGASAALAIPGGDPEFLLARESAITAILGVVVLGSIARPRPVMFIVGRAVLAGAGHDPSPWDERWRTSARFRRLWRTITASWGAGLAVHATLGVVLAVTLPVDVVPLATTAAWIGLVVVLQVITQVLLRIPRHRELVFG